MNAFSLISAFQWDHTGGTEDNKTGPDPPKRKQHHYGTKIIIMRDFNKVTWFYIHIFYFFPFYSSYREEKVLKFESPGHLFVVFCFAVSTTCFLVWLCCYQCFLPTFEEEKYLCSKIPDWFCLYMKRKEKWDVNNEAGFVTNKTESHTFLCLFLFVKLIIVKQLLHLMQMIKCFSCNCDTSYVYGSEWAKPRR